MNEKMKNTLYQLLTNVFPKIDAFEEKLLSEKNVELTIKEVRILATIEKSEIKSLGVIANTLIITPGALSIAISRLEKKRYIKRLKDNTDKRITSLSLTPKGKKVVKLYKEMLNDMILQFTKELRLGETSILIRTLENVNTFFNEKIKP